VQVVAAFFVYEPEEAPQGAGAEPLCARVGGLLQLCFQCVAMTRVEQRLAKTSRNRVAKGCVQPGWDVGH
jgi:hypothetical protein